MTRVRPHRRPSLASIGLLGLLLTLSCRRAGPGTSSPPPAAAPPPPVLGAVTLRDLTPPSGAPVSLDVSALEDQLRARIIASGLFGGGGAGTDGGISRAVVRVRGEIALDGAEVEDKGMARAAVRLKLDTRPSESPGAIDEELAGQGEQIYPIAPPARAKPRRVKSDRARDPAAVAGPGGDEKRALFSRLVLRVAGDLIDGLAAREMLHAGTSQAIHAALRQDGGELQEQAIHIAGERKLRDEVPVLLELLDNPSEPVRDAALGALIQIGDRRAVGVLTRSRSLRDRREMRKIVAAIATLGGDEALDYLSFVAASHDDEEIRALAAAAKTRLERHASSTSP